MPQDRDVKAKTNTNKSQLSDHLMSEYSETTSDLVMTWLKKSAHDFSKTRLDIIDRIAQVADSALIQLIYEKRDDGYKHAYGYADQRDSMSEEDYQTLIAFSENDVRLDEKIGPIFDFLADFRYFDPEQSQCVYEDSEEEEDYSPFDDPNTLEYKLQGAVKEYCKEHIASLQTAKEYKQFQTLLSTLKQEGADCIWPKIKDDIAYRIEEDDRHSMKSYKDLMKEAEMVRHTPLPTLPHFQAELEGSKGYRDYCVKVMAKQTFKRHKEAYSEHEASLSIIASP